MLGFSLQDEYGHSVHSYHHLVFPGTCGIIYLALAWCICKTYSGLSAEIGNYLEKKTVRMGILLWEQGNVCICGTTTGAGFTTCAAL